MDTSEKMKVPIKNMIDKINSKIKSEFDRNDCFSDCDYEIDYDNNKCIMIVEFNNSIEIRLKLKLNFEDCTIQFNNEKKYTIVETDNLADDRLIPIIKSMYYAAINTIYGEFEFLDDIEIEKIHKILNEALKEKYIKCFEFIRDDCLYYHSIIAKYKRGCSEYKVVFDIRKINNVYVFLDTFETKNDLFAVSSVILKRLTNFNKMNFVI